MGNGDGRVDAVLGQGDNFTLAVFERRHRTVTQAGEGADVGRPGANPAAIRQQLQADKAIGGADLHANSPGSRSAQDQQAHQRRQKREVEREARRRQDGRAFFMLVSLGLRSEAGAEAAPPGPPGLA